GANRTVDAARNAGQCLLIEKFRPLKIHFFILSASPDTVSGRRSSTCCDSTGKRVYRSNRYKNDRKKRLTF
ncbi:MAG: hypothetical protein WBV91_13025, partial [Desulfobacterales bacterium]